MLLPPSIRSGIPALGGSLRTAMVDRTSAMTIDGRLALSSRSNASGHGSLHRVHGVVDGVHRAAGPLNHLGRHRPLDGAPGMHSAAHAARNQQPGEETQPDPLRSKQRCRTLRLSEGHRIKMIIRYHSGEGRQSEALADLRRYSARALCGHDRALCAREDVGEDRCVTGRVEKTVRESASPGELLPTPTCRGRFKAERYTPEGLVLLLGRKEAWTPFRLVGQPRCMRQKRTWARFAEVDVYASWST
jgi:hypothetical protein